MTEIIIKSAKDPHDVDAPKDCQDFVPLNDGTIKGDSKYCDNSRKCRQYDPIRELGFLSQRHEWYEFGVDDKGEVVMEPVCDYLCTGKFPIFEERHEDERAR